MLLEEPVPLLEDSNCSGSGDETSASTCSSNSELTSKEDHGLLESTMDDVLREYAPFSFYQKRLTAVCALAVLVLAPHAAILVFIGDEPDWFCDGNSAKVLGQSNVITVANKSHLNRQADCHLFHSGQCTPQYTNPIAKASAEVNMLTLTCVLQCLQISACYTLSSWYTQLCIMLPRWRKQEWIFQQSPLTIIEILLRSEQLLNSCTVELRN